ncbi:lytic murein transglycosylase [Xylophilus sp. GOD-11R]|uniref:lytic murein transglycosylase n=1 Tax=Xylophilus sp. GOD-11R TaxID=3089814 RepID=UPI00298CD21E|nr:lytic murein transglycosylase [Xylophilus sp. GOD-11R]WPB55173.1 lytic murein transglycosylase [Xylophilus sp. GOD-11R]
MPKVSRVLSSDRLLQSFATIAVATTIVGCASAPPAAVAPAPSVTAPVDTTAAPNATPALRQSPTSPDGFNQWLDGVRQSAAAAGIDPTTLGTAFNGVRFLPQVVELDGRQPEFTRAVWDYLDNAVSPQRIARGRAKWEEVRTDGAAAAARYGVPASVVMAIWGMESNYGSNYGDISTIDALATLGFEGRREQWAREQLLAALRILQNGDIDRAHMIGSWAGAMGQTQFLPSNFLAYAVDADGDGRRDIWGSMADVTASTANFLARSGWQRDEPWGYEVALPAGFDPGRADTRTRQSSERWQAEGLRTPQGAALPAIADATVLLPAGVRGPAFLVGANFRAILRYNNSVSYALAVGLLSQQLAGEPGVLASWPRDLVTLSRSQLMQLQTALNDRNFASGQPDGMMGPATRDGIRAWQRSIGQPADGYPTLDLLERLQSTPR